MLFVVLGHAKASTSVERIARRAKWQYPQGVRVIGEYWPIGGGGVSLIIIAEADSVPPVMAATMQWEDVFDMRVMTAVTAEEGLRMASLAAQGAPA